MLPHKFSQLGPAVAVADINGDGLDDVFLGGGHTQAGKILLGQSDGKFKNLKLTALESDRQKEDLAACFFDLENDGDLDLYVASGSYEFNEGSKLLQDRIYINDGMGNLSKSGDILPMLATTNAVVRPADYDQDGDIDLFVGGRILSGKYPYPPISYLLINNGGQFSVGTAKWAPNLERVGMVTDATWVDLDADDDLDLVLTGEWMGIEVFTNDQGILSQDEQYQDLQNTKGWWNKLVVTDVDKDGDQDIIAGNVGLNTKFHPTNEHPFHVYTNDFDYNGTVDVFLAKYYNDIEVPVRGKTCSAQQLPHLASKIPTYNDFANRDIKGILGPAIESALHYEVNEFRSGIFINQGKAKFAFQPFENAAQQTVVNSILLEDFDGDNLPDLLFAGNNYMPEIETTRYDAGIGAFLKGQSDQKFKAISHLESGFFVDKDVRNLQLLDMKQGRFVLVLNNNAKHQLFKISASPSL